jgi:acetyl-CoA carboxylase carboxyltransferase component/enoyl-CoA hydratase/carnithine racemase
MADLIYDIVDATAVITLNRPKQLNALSTGLQREYFDALDEACADPVVRAIVVTGAGRAFSAGADVAELQTLNGANAAETNDPRGNLHAMRIGKPVIAAINGPCVGLGLVHALACDIRFASERASFCTMFARRGLIAEEGLSWLLPQITGRALALDLLLTARTIDAKESLSVHLVSAVVDHAQLVNAVIELGDRIGREVSPASIQTMKGQVSNHAVASIDLALEESRLLTTKSLDGHDFREGVASLIERRAPRFASLPLRQIDRRDPDTNICEELEMAVSEQLPTGDASPVPATRATAGETVRAQYHVVSDAARPATVEYQHSRGKATARERIEMLTDTGTFVEFGALARPEEPGPDGNPIWADGMITGTARIDGRPVAVIASDFTAAGGSNGALGNIKTHRLWDLAADEGIPVVMLLEGGGHRIQEGLDSREFAYGVDHPFRQAQLSGWVPMVVAILGPGFAGPTLLAGMCDFVVGVDGLSTMGIAPPALVRHATGEQVTEVQLGGAAVQARRGLVDFVADTEREALDAIRAFLSYLPSNSSDAAPAAPNRGADAKAAAALDDIVPSDPKRAYDVRDVIAGIADELSVFEVKADFAGNIVTTFIRIAGRRVGVVANQPCVRAGAIDSDACDKVAHFVALCDAYGLPLLFLVDVPGFLVGTKAEETNLGRRGAKLLYELASATVPRYTVIMRKGYGAAYIAMSGGRSFSPELCLSWPRWQRWPSRPRSTSRTAAICRPQPTRWRRRPGLSQRHAAN